MYVNFDVKRIIKMAHGLFDEIYVYIRIYKHIYIYIYDWKPFNGNNKRE